MRNIKIAGFIFTVLFFISCAQNKKEETSPNSAEPANVDTLGSKRVDTAVSTQPAPTDTTRPIARDSAAKTTQKSKHKNAGHPYIVPTLAPDTIKIIKKEINKPADTVAAIKIPEIKPNPKPANASIVVAANTIIPEGASRNIELTVDLDALPDELKNAIQQNYNQHISYELKNQGDTMQTFRFQLPAGRFFTIQINYDAAFIKLISPLKPERKELANHGKTIWRWTVFALKKTKQTTISFTVITETSDGKINQNSELPITVEISGRHFKYTWLIIVVILSLVVFYTWKKLRQVLPDSRVYFSYAWGDAKKDIMTDMYESLKKDGFNVIRDKENAGYRNSITDFMIKIGKAKFVIVAINDKYLKSHFCMFELYGVYQYSNLDKEIFMSKIFPLRLENINLADPIVTDQYIEYWKALRVNWKARLDQADENIVEQTKQLEIITRIETELGNLLSILSDANASDMENLCKNDFAEVKSSIKKAMNSPFYRIIRWCKKIFNN